MIANYSELMAYGVGFQKVEIIKETVGGVTTTTVYSGRTCRTDVTRETEDLRCWKIRRNVIKDSGMHQIVIETWAEGSWTERENLTYQYKQLL